MNTTVEPRVYDVRTVAELLSVTRNHIYDLCRAGELQHIRLGRRVVIPKQAVEDLLAGRVGTNGAKPAA